ncbi:MAG: hypothetical protein VW701_11035, partial [Deltaproteobacteria bacterium]
MPWPTGASLPFPVQPFHLDDSTTSTKQTVGSYPLFSPVDVLPFCYRKAGFGKNLKTKKCRKSAGLLQLFAAPCRRADWVELITKEKER